MSVYTLYSVPTCYAQVPTQQTANICIGLDRAFSSSETAETHFVYHGEILIHIFQIQTALAVIYGRALSPLLDSYGPVGS